MLTSLGFTRSVLPVRARECARAAPPPRRASSRCCRALRGSGVNRRDPQHTLGPIGLQVGAAEEPVTREQREDVVPVGALVLALVDLDHVPEAEEALEQRPVPHEVVEGAHEHRRRGSAVELRPGRT